MGVENADGILFVNGVAAEQQTAGETAQPADERAEAIKAVKAALEEEGKSAARAAKEAEEQEPAKPRDNVERDESGKFIKQTKTGTPDDKPEPKADDEAESLKNVLKQRKQIAAVKAQQNQELAKQHEQLRQYKAQLDAEKADMAREKARYAALRSDPARAIREIGYEPEEFILDLATENTPEGVQRRQQRALADQLKEIQDWKADQARQAQEWKERQAEQQNVQYRKNVENAFLGIALNEEKHPHLASLYSGHEQGLLAEADVVAEQYRNLTGKEASFDDVAEYLEERAVNWYNSMSTRSQQGTQSKAPVTKGKPTPGNATGRTLSPEDASERRALGTPLKDLDGDERLAAAREAVGAAFRHSGERT